MKCDECKQEKEIYIKHVLVFDIICQDCNDKIKSEKVKMQKYLNRKRVKDSKRKTRYNKWVDSQLKKRELLN
jgi:hypothetical protein